MLSQLLFAITWMTNMATTNELAAKNTSVNDESRVRAAIQRSLPYLEAEAVAWVKQRNCSTCHHVPMMLWTHYEAKSRGFETNEKRVDELRIRGQSAELRGPTTNWVTYFALSLGAAPESDREAAKDRQKLVKELMNRQDKNGSWPMTASQPPDPPMLESNESLTLLALLVLASEPPASFPKELASSRKRALAWLKDAPAQDSNQSLVFQILLKRKLDQKDEAQVLVKQLLSRQDKEDGGWSQTANRPSDALATGQALYALSMVGMTGKDPEIQRAWGFLLSRQQKDGSWSITPRNEKRKGFVISPFGTGWATLGLLRTLPN
jgi:squalene-hopene/tetraprenyl-beta-curcumene cyclase